jgi:hypothetical protein
VGVGGSVTVNTLNAHTHAWIGNADVNSNNTGAISTQEVFVLAAHETHPSVLPAARNLAVRPVSALASTSAF